MQCGKMVGLLAIADATSRIDLSCMWTCVWPLHLKDVVYADIWWQWARRTGLPNATKLTTGKLTAAVAHESLWDAIREDGGLEDFHHLRDRLALRQPTGDDRAGMVVQDGNHIAIKAILLKGVEITEVHRPYGMRCPSFKGAPMAWRVYDRWHRQRMLSQDTLYGI